jgi:hypothetical protein
MKKILFISIILLSSCSSKYKNKTIDDVFTPDETITLHEEKPMIVKKEIIPEKKKTEVITKKEKPTIVNNTKEEKDEFKFNLKQETVKYKAYAIGLHAGNATMSILPDKLISEKRVLHFSLTMETSSFFSNIYLLKSKIDSYVLKENFKPLKYVQSSIEGDNTKLLIETIDYDNNHSHVYKKYNNKVEKNNNKNFNTNLSNLSDLLQIIFYIRTNIDNLSNLNVINNQKIKEVSIQKIGNEVIDVENEKIKAIKVKIINNNKTQYLWINPNNNNQIVKIEISLPVGSGYLLITK